MNGTQKWEVYESDQLEFADPAAKEVRRTGAGACLSETGAGVSKPHSLSYYSWIFSFAFSFMLFLYEPLQLYFSDVAEFRYEV